MPKFIKGLAGRKPPVPGATPADVAAWCREVMPRVQPVVEQVNAQICATPGLSYALHRGRALYGLPDQGWIVELAPYHVSVNVLFFGGADFASPPPLGETDRTRYVKIGFDDELPADLPGWIEQAVRTPGWAWRRASVATLACAPMQGRRARDHAAVPSSPPPIRSSLGPAVVAARQSSATPADWAPISPGHTTIT